MDDIIEMNYDEFLEKYGDVEVTFSSYYKYSFRYAAVLKNGNRIIVSVGGNSDDIYKLEVYNDDCHTIGWLQPTYGHVTDTDGVLIEEFVEN